MFCQPSVPLGENLPCHGRATSVSFLYPPREGSALLEQQARKYLGMSGDEFRRQYWTGMLDTEEARVIRVSMVLPLAED